jgi:hypothetical protein
MVAPILAALTQLLLPLVLLYDLGRVRERSRLAWLVKAAYTAELTLFVFVAGRWDWTSYYLRYATVGLLVGTVIAAYPRVRRLPSWGRERPARSALMGGIVINVFLLALLLLAVRGRFYDGDPVRLAAPLRDGAYYVAHGGDSSLVNHHNTHRAQRYALDIVQLNRYGARAWGLFPSDLDRFVISGASVHSPCDGTIVEAVDGLPDLIPPARDREHPAGNHVVIECGDVRVELAHLQNGSARPPGTIVVTGDLVGRVGNSGNTSEPHLHMHAIRAGTASENGEGVPMLLDGTFPVRNTVFLE